MQIHINYRVSSHHHHRHHLGHLSVSEVQVITHLHGQRAVPAAGEVHDAVLAAAVRHVVHRKNALARRVGLRRIERR